MLWVFGSSGPVEGCREEQVCLTLRLPSKYVMKMEGTICHVCSKRVLKYSKDGYLLVTCGELYGR